MFTPAGFCTLAVMLVVLRESWNPLVDALECARATRLHAMVSWRGISSATEKVTTSQWRVTETREMITTTDRLLANLRREIISRPD